MNRTFESSFILTALTLLAASAVFAEPSGASIMQAEYDRPRGKDMSGVLTMTLVDAKGKERVRSIKQESGSFGSVDKKIMMFLSPPDVRGTSFMTWSYEAKGKGDDQWIYLPALKRVKRISSEGKSDYFMGSDFTFDDLGARKPSEDSHELAGSESIDGEPCWVVESSVKDRKYLYSKTITWVSKEKNIGMKREYFDARGALLKTLKVASVESISGVWVINKTEMHNVQKDHRTRIEFTEIKINVGVSEDAFSERAMTKGL